MRRGLPRAASPATAAIAPGCVLLSVDALLEADCALPDAAQAARFASALRESGFAGHPAAASGVVLVGGARAPLSGAAAGWPQMPLALALPPRALSLEGPGEWVALPCCLAGTPGLAWAARCSGHALAVEAQPGALLLARAQLRALGGQGGCVLLSCVPLGSPGDAEPLRSAPRALLVCACGSLAAQLDAALLVSPAGADGPAQSVMRVLGDALRHKATPRVRVAAAAVAVWLGCGALVTVLQAMEEEEEGSVEGSTGGSGEDVAMDLALAALAQAALATPAGVLGAATVATAASAVASPAAWLLASALLSEASDAHAHALPEAAALAALDRAWELDGPDGRGAARVLRAVQRAVLRQQAEPWEAQLDGADESAAALLFRVHTRARAWDAVGLLLLQRAALLAAAAAREVLLRPATAWPDRLGPGSAALVRHTRLWPAAGGPALALQAAPWLAVVQATRAFSLLALLPLGAASAAILLAMRQLQRGRFAIVGAAALHHRLFLALAVSVLGGALGDALLLHSTGGVVEWPLPLLAAGACCGLLFHGAALLDLAHSHALLLLQLLAAAGIPVLAGRWDLLARPAWGLQLLAIAASAALVRRADARAHALFVAARAGVRRAAKKD